MSQLADWKCHKVVKAGKIVRCGASWAVVEDVNGAECTVALPPGVFTRGTAKPGDYIVIYDDGYKSWSPAKAFEEGYTRLSAPEVADAAR